MKKQTLIACILIVAVLVTWYFINNSKKNKVEVSVVGMKCDKTVPEIYLLVMNNSDKEVKGDIKLTFTDKQSNKKSTITYGIHSTVQAHQFRQDTAFISQDIFNFDCDRYEIQAKVKK